MNKITLLFLLLFTQTIFAQFSPNNVEYFVGTGNKTVYLVVDFNDEYSSNSYVWGYRFDENDLTMEDLINAIADDEPAFNVEIPGGFLYSLSYNHHNPSTDDYWATWSGNASNNLSMNSGINIDPLIDGRWYGLSYGFPEDFDLEPSHPREPIPAYSSQWLQMSQVTNWLGAGTNQSLVVVDFGTNTNEIANSYVFGIKYNEEISANEALQLIQQEVSYFNFSMNENQIATLNLGSFSGNSTDVNSWEVHKGTDLSNWQLKTDLTQVTLSNNDWLGLSFSSRRPFTPQFAETLSNDKNKKIEFTIYPNPTSDNLNIESSEDIKEIIILNIQGKEMIKTTEKSVNVSALASGMYLLNVKTANASQVLKFIKK